jgi:hypothetical protein
MEKVLTVTSDLNLYSGKRVLVKTSVLTLVLIAACIGAGPAWSHQPFQCREGAMTKFRDVKTLQKFSADRTSIHNHFNYERHLSCRDIFEQDRANVLAEWRQLAA